LKKSEENQNACQPKWTTLCEKKGKAEDLPKTKSKEENPREWKGETVTNSGKEHLKQKNKQKKSIKKKKKKTCPRRGKKAKEKRREKTDKNSRVGRAAKSGPRIKKNPENGPKTICSARGPRT